MVHCASQQVDISLGIKFGERVTVHMTSNDTWLNWGCRDQEIPCFT